MPERMRADVDRNANNIDRLDNQYDRIKVLVVAALGGIVLLAFLIVFVQYQGRVELRDRLVVGCAAATKDRALQANAWNEARKARLQTTHDPTVSNAARVSAAHAAGEYRNTVARLVARADRSELSPELRVWPDAGSFDCSVAYPAPSFLPLGSSEPR